MKTDVIFEWDDQFSAEDYIVDVRQLEIVMDVNTVAYILDEYTLDFNNNRFQLAKNAKGPLRHQKP
jgi:Fe-S cluster assembly iron-binding protein IscA